MSVEDSAVNGMERAAQITSFVVENDEHETRRMVRFTESGAQTEWVIGKLYVSKRWSQIAYSPKLRITIEVVDDEEE